MADSQRQFKEKGVQLRVEAACSGIKFGQGGLKAVLDGGRKFKVMWWLLWGGSGGFRTTRSVGGGKQPWKWCMVSGSH